MIQECIYKMEMNPQTEKTNLWLPKGKKAEGSICNLGLTDTNHYIQDRETRTYYIQYLI